MLLLLTFYDKYYDYFITILTIIIKCSKNTLILLSKKAIIICYIYIYIINKLCIFFNKYVKKNQDYKNVARLSPRPLLLSQ